MYFFATAGAGLLLEACEENLLLAAVLRRDVR
jgi:hypothetical protein